MIGPISAVQGQNDLIKINSVNNLNGLGHVKHESIQKLDDFMTDKDASNIAIDDGANADDNELKVDLKGFVQKNQEYANDFSLDGSKPGVANISSGEVVNKFSGILDNYIHGVNTQNKAAEKAVETFASGGNIDLHSVMIATEKAELSLQLAAQMRNKFIQAYQEISRTQI